MTIQQAQGGSAEERWGITGSHRDTEESQGTVMGRAQEEERGAGGTMTEIWETHWELEMPHWDCWVVMGASQDMGERLGLLW